MNPDDSLEEVELDIEVPKEEKEKTVCARLILTAEQENDLREAFNSLDHLGEGKIKADDFRVVIKALGYEPTKEELLHMVNAVDKGNTGKLSFENFQTAIMRKIMSLDTDGDIMKSFRLFDMDDSDMADEDIEEKCEQLMNVVVDSRKKFGKMCVDYELKSSLMENQMLKLQLEIISNHRFKPKHTVPDLMEDNNDMENFAVEVMERQQKIENLRKRLKNTQEVVLQLKTDNVGKQLRDPITAEAMLEKAKLKNLN
ncbi:uncharacterized protein LOC128676552 isoform X2 [Plodia interpunctella]|uniref:uncharacterized protein LOC128676552 isoform X2 n=1 Tax=Plodia interpunctella TaxID=58824 RepID=UPI0031013B57